MIWNNVFFKIIILFFVSIFCLQFCYVFADDVELDENENYIFEEKNISESIETSSKDINNLNINARSAIVLDRTSSNILYGKNEFRKVKMASTTKIMTAIVIIENCDLSQTVEVSKKAANTGGSRLDLKTGDKLTITDLLYGLMLRSGNDAAVCLAETCSGSITDFANLMNLKAKELGLSNTNFETPHGLDSDLHYTTAYELALLTNYALKNPTFSKIVGTKTYTININGYPRTLSNTNELLGNYNGVYGVKTGFTNGANRCLVTACKKNDMDIICVVLGCDTKKFRTSDSVKLIEYATTNYKYVNIKNIIDKNFSDWKNENLSNISIVKASISDIYIYYSELPNPIIPISLNDIDSIEVSFELNEYLEAPINYNDKLGKIYVRVNGNSIAECDILSDCNIKRKNIFFYMYSLFKEINYIKII